MCITAAPELFDVVVAVNGMVMSMVSFIKGIRFKVLRPCTPGGSWAGASVRVDTLGRGSKYAEDYIHSKSQNCPQLNTHVYNGGVDHTAKERGEITVRDMHGHRAVATMFDATNLQDGGECTPTIPTNALQWHPVHAGTRNQVQRASIHAFRVCGFHEKWAP
jgi:hypothetical protein